MADDDDRYPNMAALFAATREGRDWRVHRRVATSEIAIVAPHGGVIEPGTIELADAMAGTHYNFYGFEAIADGLHVTSHHFDDPACISLIERSNYVVTVHGCHDSDDNGRPDLTVAIGGRDKAFGRAVRRELEEGGFAIGDSSRFPGEHPDNICNRGCRRMGIQLELSRSLRDRLMAARATGGDGPFARFAAAIDRAIRKEIGPLP